MNLDKIAKLLNLGETQPDTAEGKSALERAQRELDKLGLTREDVFGAEVTLLYPGYLPWQLALLHAVCLRIPCDFIERTHIDGEHRETEAVVRGPAQTVDAVGYLFSVLERAVKRETFEYGEPLRSLFGTEQVMPLQRTFEAYAVIGLSERLMRTEDPLTPLRNDSEAEFFERSDEADSEAEFFERSNEAEVAEDPSPAMEADSEADPLRNDSEAEFFERSDEEDTSEETLDPLDALIASLDTSDGDDLPVSLDPCIQGYRAGMRIPLSKALRAGPTSHVLTVDNEEKATPAPS